MRKVVSYVVYSLDGVTHNPQDWVYDRFDQDMVGYLKAIIDEQDAVLLGRNKYLRGLAAVLADLHPRAVRDLINNTSKYVVSTTLDEVTWQSSALIKQKLVMFPVIADQGLQRLFDGFGSPKRMQLANVERTSKGVLVLTYQPRRDPG